MEIRLEDLNHIIKVFSYCLQDRIDELDGCKNGAAYRRSQLEDGEQEVLERYRGYKIESLKEIKYAQKFCQRVLEIFSYFRGKSRSAGLLVQSEDRIISEMDAILTRHPIALDSLLSFVVAFVRKPFSVERRRPRPTEIVIVTAAVPAKEVAIRTKPLSVSEHKSRLTSSTSQHNLVRADQRKSLVGAFQRKFRPSDAEMLRLYCELNLDRLHVVRINNQLTLMQREAADRLYKEMLRRNDPILAEVAAYARKFPQRSEAAHSHSQNTIGDEKSEPAEVKILREAKKHLNLTETPTKTMGGNLKQKNPSSNLKKQHPDTIFNNWLPRRDSRRANIEESLPLEPNYNFCLKESNKLQQHRRLRKPHQ